MSGNGSPQFKVTAIRYRKGGTVLVALFAAICFLAAILPPPGEPRLFYSVTIPESTPRAITARDGTVHDARALYVQRHREGWRQRVIEFANPVRATLPYVFDTDLDVPFGCTTDIEMWAYVAGKQDCRQALNDLIAHYGAERVREALGHATASP